MTTRHVEKAQDLCLDGSGCTSCAYFRIRLPGDDKRMIGGREIVYASGRIFCDGEPFTGRLLAPRTPTSPVASDGTYVDGYPTLMIVTDFENATKTTSTYAPPGFFASKETVRLD